MDTHPLFEPVTTAPPRIEKQIFEAMAVLVKSGAFVRCTENAKFPFEAVLPGDWTKFESRGFERDAFEVMLRRGLIEPTEPGRWLRREGLRNR